MTSMEDDLLPVVQKAYDINRWLLPQIERFSRRYKFGIGSRLQETALDLCLALVEAGHARRKEAPLYQDVRVADHGSPGRSKGYAADDRAWTGLGYVHGLTH